MAGLRQLIKNILGVFGLEIRRSRPRISASEASAGSHTTQGNYKVASFGWARANQLFDFINRQLYTRWDIDAENYDVPLDLVEKHQWSLKGFGYSLVIDTVQKLHSNGKQKLRILDVGGSGSGLPRALSEQFADECWLIDDFGIESNDQQTLDWYEPNFRQTLASKNPMVHYVFGRLGGARLPELENGSFDLIYSVSTLEHIPMKMVKAVFDHMLELLAAGGVMVHTIDLGSAKFVGWQKFLMSYFRTRGVSPTIFAINNLNELGSDDPPLLESTEIVYTFWDTHPKKYYQEGTLVLEIHRCDTSCATSQ